MTDTIFTNRQPVARAADVASGPEPSQADRDATTGGGVPPLVPAGSIFAAASAAFAVLSAVLVSGPVPGLAMLEPGRVAMGIVYGCASGAFALAPAVPRLWITAEGWIIAWAKRRRWGKREQRELVRQLDELMHRADSDQDRSAAAALAEGEDISLAEAA